tara:strand:+ start:948 stop:1946 length:999 start_codon:yes stop_codon:yes gene_type:complete
MFYSILSYSLIVVLLAIYFKKKKLFSNFTGDKHQLFSNQKNIPLVGGFFLLLPLILTILDNIICIIILILIFSVGLFSDRKILISPKKRFFFQLALVLFSVILLDLQISSSKLNFFDNFLENSVFNIFFTSFCLLILINGSNFIDGLNGLLLINMSFVIFVLLKLDLLNASTINQEAMNYLIFFMFMLIFLNLVNFLMLGDAGAYAISFFVGYLIIKSHNTNPNISPYFFITLLWYPCFENLFSIIRKLKTKLSPFRPDNNHFHQLIYAFLQKKLIKNKLFANNISSFIISIFNFVIIFISVANPYSSIYQIKLIIGFTLVYLFLFTILRRN